LVGVSAAVSRPVPQPDAVDDSMRVLTSAGHISGLFAAGEAIGGFHGASYHSGAAVGQALVFGRIAGRNAAHRL
jgi:fumarate reductase flavoprotein subunit